ncbi:hypothetical protein QTH90_26900 [Variovorax sp. J2P1-59]|uniref:hypothetical protein n=1 Tax=Variovorax flavidus TaxID=3053501 RepID=UPI002577111C|nr:hypothetical protein [Variovorax sp. J2P1-59]MDM0078065.1 hypothetical protein [Variovorax sp. J2P1-59]
MTAALRKRLLRLLCTAATAWVVLGSAGAFEARRMTGEGGFICPYLTLQRVTHKFDLNCGMETDGPGASPKGPNELKISLSGGADFHLTRLRTGQCSSEYTAVQNRPASIQTFHGEGLGSFGGLDASISFAFTDAGESGAEDTAEFEIKLLSNAATAIACKPELPLIMGFHRAYGPDGTRREGLQFESTAAAERSALPNSGGLRGQGGALYSPFSSSDGRSNLKPSMSTNKEEKAQSTGLVVVVGAVSFAAAAAVLGFLVHRLLR